MLIMLMLPGSADLFAAGKRPHHLPVNRIWRYNVRYDNDSLGIHTSEPVTLRTTGKESIETMQMELVQHFGYSRKDSIMCKKLPSIGWTHTCVTGMIETDTSLWLHPIRHNQYLIMESAPFPEVRFPIRDSMEYVVPFNTSGGWDYLSDVRLTFTYRVAGKEIKNGITYWHIHATSKFIEGPMITLDWVADVDYLYSEAEGFYSFDYSFFDHTHISFQPAGK